MIKLGAHASRELSHELTSKGRCHSTCMHRRFPIIAGSLLDREIFPVLSYAEGFVFPGAIILQLQILWQFMICMEHNTFVTVVFQEKFTTFLCSE